LEWTSSRVLEPNNPATDKMLAIENGENHILDYPFALGASLFDALDARHWKYK